LLHALGLWLFCFGLWLLLSGYFDVPLLLSFGVLSCALVVFVAWRTEAIDPEERPLRLRLNLHVLGYWPWLLWQIVLANLDVAKRIVDPKLPISPTLITLKPSQRSDLGRVIYANSITLTPGTVTTDLSGDTLEVHALTREAADSLLEGDMDRRVTRLEGGD
jgi:multicomponent Na+:H+ antiporter subunit E